MYRTGESKTTAEGGYTLEREKYTKGFRTVHKCKATFRGVTLATWTETATRGQETPTVTDVELHSLLELPCSNVKGKLDQKFDRKDDDELAEVVRFSVPEHRLEDARVVNALLIGLKLPRPSVPEMAIRMLRKHVDGGRLNVVCTAAQFARFIIARHKYGAENMIAELNATLSTEKKPERVLMAVRWADAPGADL